MRKIIIPLFILLLLFKISSTEAYKGNIYYLLPGYGFPEIPELNIFESENKEIVIKNYGIMKEHRYLFDKNSRLLISYSESGLLGRGLDKKEIHYTYNEYNQIINVKTNIDNFYFNAKIIDNYVAEVLISHSDIDASTIEPKSYIYLYNKSSNQNNYYDHYSIISTNQILHYDLNNQILVFKDEQDSKIFTINDMLYLSKKYVYSHSSPDVINNYSNTIYNKEGFPSRTNYYSENPLNSEKYITWTKEYSYAFDSYHRVESCLVSVIENSNGNISNSSHELLFEYINYQKLKYEEYWNDYKMFEMEIEFIPWN